MKTKIFCLIFLSSLIFSSISQASMFCGLGGLALEDKYGHCQITLDTCETQELFAQGWMPTKTGKCGEPTSPDTICGFGGTRMINHRGYTVRTLNTCETQKLKVQGWDFYQN